MLQEQTRSGILARGDRLIFEDGTEARIKQEPGEKFHVWDNPTPADFEEVKRAVGLLSASDWAELFSLFEEQPKRSGCFSISAILVAVCAVAASLPIRAASCGGSLFIRRDQITLAVTAPRLIHATGRMFPSEASQPALCRLTFIALFSSFHRVLREKVSVGKSTAIILVEIIDKTTLSRTMGVEEVSTIDRGDYPAANRASESISLASHDVIDDSLDRGEFVFARSLARGSPHVKVSVTTGSRCKCAARRDIEDVGFQF